MNKEQIKGQIISRASSFRPANKTIITNLLKQLEDAISGNSTEVAGCSNSHLENLEHYRTITEGLWAIGKDPSSLTKKEIIEQSYQLEFTEITDVEFEDVLNNLQPEVTVTGQLDEDEQDISPDMTEDEDTEEDEDLKSPDGE